MQPTPSAPPAEKIDLKDPALYLNRELSLLAFQRRVLEEAEDESNPLLERVKFLAIVGSNLDEFFMVRVAGLAAQVDAGAIEMGPDGMSPRSQLVAIRREAKRLMNDAQRTLEKLMEALKQEGIVIHEYAELNEGQLRRASKYFAETVFPVLTPLAFDPGRPFPHISNLSLNLAVLIRDSSGDEHFARVKVPDSLPQLVPLSGTVEAQSEAHSAQEDRPGVAGTGDRGESLGAVSRHGDTRSPSLPRHPRRRYRHQGTGSRGPAGNHRGGRAPAALRQRGAAHGGAGTCPRPSLPS